MVLSFAAVLEHSSATAKTQFVSLAHWDSTAPAQALVAPAAARGLSTRSSECVCRVDPVPTKSMRAAVSRAPQANTRIIPLRRPKRRAYRAPPVRTKPRPVLQGTALLAPPARSRLAPAQLRAQAVHYAQLARMGLAQVLQAQMDALSAQQGRIWTALEQARPQTVQSAVQAGTRPAAE